MQPEVGTDIGLGDKNSKPFKLGDYVKLDCGDFDIKGQIIYGFYSCGRDEWDHHYKTVGFFVKYSDGSGTSGISPKWEIIDRSEYEEEN